MTWREAIENIKEVRNKAEEVFQDKDGALRMAGFKADDLRLAVEEIHLPGELERALPRVDVQRLQAEAAPFESEQRAEETVGAFMEGLSKSLGMTREDIEQELKDNPKEFLEKHKETVMKVWDVVHRRMAIDGGSFIDIRVPDGTGLEALLALLKRMPMGRSPRKGGEGSLSAAKSPSDEEYEGTLAETAQEVLGKGR